MNVDTKELFDLSGMSEEEIEELKKKHGDLLHMVEQQDLQEEAERLLYGKKKVKVKKGTKLHTWADDIMRMRRRGRK